MSISHVISFIYPLRKIYGLVTFLKIESPDDDQDLYPLLKINKQVKRKLFEICRIYIEFYVYLYGLVAANC